MYGELPTLSQLKEWTTSVSANMLIHEFFKKFLEGFRYDAHAMGIFIGTLGAKSTFYPASKNVLDPQQRMLEAVNIIASVPTIAAYSYRHNRGAPYVYPDQSLSYVSNFLNMLFRMEEGRDDYYRNPVIERAMEVLFILHADHEQNCSTTTMRTVGSALSDPYSAISAAAGALYGQLHGGANQEALEMLAQIGSKENIPSFIQRVKNHETRLMGFGHRVYKNYDPRAKIIKKMADQVLEVTRPDPLIDVAKELEHIALNDEYFIKRKLYPNVDFYSGIIYKALGFPVDMFPVLFAVARTAGWLAHWLELMGNEDERKIVRPRQQYVGQDLRDYVHIDDRV
jgi:citrate synthase